MVKHILKKILKESLSDPIHAYPNLEERCPDRQCIRLDVPFEDLVYVRHEPIPYLRLFFYRPVLGRLKGNKSLENRCDVE